MWDGYVVLTGTIEGCIVGRGWGNNTSRYDVTRVCVCHAGTYGGGGTAMSRKRCARFRFKIDLIPVYVFVCSKVFGLSLFVELSVLLSPFTLERMSRLITDYLTYVATAAADAALADAGVSAFLLSLGLVADSDETHAALATATLGTPSGTPAGLFRVRLHAPTSLVLASRSHVWRSA